MRVKVILDSDRSPLKMTCLRCKGQPDPMCSICHGEVEVNLDSENEVLMSTAYAAFAERRETAIARGKR